MLKTRRMGKKARRRKIIKRSILGTLMGLFVVLTLFASYVCYAVYDLQNQMYTPIEETNMREEAVDTDNLDPVSILLMGVDQREDETTGRADALMVATIDPKSGQAYVVSIPRDSYVEIPGYGYDKINHSYAYGGAELCVRTVEQFLDIPIDYYISLNFKGFEQVVDALGGVTVYNEFAFSVDDSYFPEGELHLDGHDTLNYVRMRKLDGTNESDFTRQERQAEVIAALAEQAKNLDSVNDVVEIFEACGENLSTNLSPTTIWDMMWDYAPAINTVTYMQMDYESYQPEDTWYAKVDDECRLAITNTLRSSLGLDLRPRSYYIDLGWEISEDPPQGKAISGDETAEDVQEEYDPFEFTPQVHEIVR